MDEPQPFTEEQQITLDRRFKSERAERLSNARKCGRRSLGARRAVRLAHARLAAIEGLPVSKGIVTPEEIETAKREGDAALAKEEKQC